MLGKDMENDTVSDTEQENLGAKIMKNQNRNSLSS